MGKKITEFDPTGSPPDNAKFLLEDVDGAVAGDPGQYYYVDVSALPGGPASGDMSKATYDPTNVFNDAFDMDNMAEGITKLILTSAERAAIIANSAKITNQTHTGHVTGSTDLTIANSVITAAMLNTLGTPDGTKFLRDDFTWITVPTTGLLLASNNLSDVANALTATQNLSVEVGVDVQAYDATLQTISGLIPSANQMIYYTAPDTAALTTLSAFARDLIDDGDAATMRTTLDVDPSGTDNSTDVTLAGAPDYITISGQVITRNLIDLSTDVTDDLPLGNLAQAGAWTLALRNAATLGDLSYTKISALTDFGALGTGDKFIIEEATGELRKIDFDDLGSATETLTNKTLDDFSNFVAANETHIQGFNITGGTLTKGTPVYISGFNVGQDAFEIDKADADDPSKMPASGLVEDDINNGFKGQIVVAGNLEGVDTSSYTEGDALFVSTTAGELTATRPTASAASVQKMGLVTKSNITLGSILVVGAGRSNDIPNRMSDAQFRVADDGDLTKLLQFQISGLTTATTRTATWPDSDGTVVLEAFAQTLTNKTIDGDNNTISNLDLGNEVDWAAAADVSDRSAAPATGDKFLMFEAGVGFRKIDYDDLPGAGGGISSLLEDTTPQLGGQLDVNTHSIGDGTLELLSFSETGSAVNEFTIANAATGNAPVLSATGDNTDIGITLTPKGTGNITLGNFVFDGDQSVGAGQDNYVLKYDNGAGLISLEAEVGGSGHTIGTDDQIPFVNATGTDMDYDSTFKFSGTHMQIGTLDDSLSIGLTSNTISSTSYALLVNTSTLDRGVGVRNVEATSSGTFSEFSLIRDDGAAMGAGHGIGRINFYGAKDASNTLGWGARIWTEADILWTANERGTDLCIGVNKGGTQTTPAEIMRLGPSRSDDPDLYFGNSTVGSSIYINHGTNLPHSNVAGWGQIFIKDVGGGLHEPYYVNSSGTQFPLVGGDVTWALPSGQGDGRIPVMKVGANDELVGLTDFRYDYITEQALHIPGRIVTGDNTALHRSAGGWGLMTKQNAGVVCINEASSGTSFSTAASIVLWKDDGAAISANHAIGVLDFASNYDAGTVGRYNAFTISCVAAELWSATQRGSQTTFWNTKAGATAQEAAIRIISDNSFRVEEHLHIQERAGRGTSYAGYGQIYVKNTVPTQLWYADDAGTESRLDNQAGGGGAPFADTTSIVEGSADNTKELRFEVDGFTTGTVRVLTPPDSDGTLVLEAFAQTLTNKTIDGDNNTLSNLDLGNEVDWAVISDVSDRSAFASGDKILIYEAGVGMRKIDYDDLPGAGGGLSNIVEDTTPQLGGDLDVNGFSLGNGDVPSLELLSFSETASAVNEFTIANAATTNPPVLSATGGDTNIGITLTPKGTGNIKLGTMEFDSDQTIGAGQDNYVLTYDHASTSISLEESAAGGGGGGTDIEAWIEISSETLSGDGNFAAVTIPAGYDELEVQFNQCESDRTAAATDQIWIEINDDTTAANYEARQLIGITSTSVSAWSGSDRTVGHCSAATDTGKWGTMRMRMYNVGTTAKETSWETTGGGGGIVGTYGGTWENTAVITKLEFSVGIGTNFKSGSQLKVYGRKTVNTGAGGGGGGTDIEALIEIATETLSSDSNFASVTIPAGYDAIDVDLYVESDRSANLDDIEMTINSDTTAANYTRYRSYVTGSSSLNGGNAEDRSIGIIPAANLTGELGLTKLELRGVSDTGVNTHWRCIGGGAGAASTSSGEWSSTSVVTSIAFAPLLGTNFKSGSKITVYGQKTVNTGGGGGGADTDLGNLTATAINLSLVSDTDITDDLGTAALRWKDVYAATLNTGDTAADTLKIRGRDVDGASWVDYLTVTANNSPTCVVTNTTLDADNNTVSNMDFGNEVDWAAANDVPDRSAAPASGDKFVMYEAGVGFRKIDYDDLPGAGSGANTNLGNLTATAINLSLISDTDITDDLGTEALRWRDVYAATLNTGQTAADTLKLRGYDVDGAAFVDILTVTANNTVTADLHSSVTHGGLELVDVSGAQTLTDKTLTSPRIGTSILDTNGNELFILTATGSAVNEVTYANAATGNDPTFTASGETNVGISLQGKGTGNITLGNYVFDGDQTVGAGQDNYVLTYDHASTSISLEAAAGGGGSTDYTIPPATDHTGEGTTSNDLNAGQTITIMNVVRMASDGKWDIADASTEAGTSGILAIALEGGTDTNPLNVLFYGIARDDTWNWTPGATLFLSTTGGAITATAPTAATEAVRVVGTALTADVIFFNPSPDYVVLT